MQQGQWRKEPGISQTPVTGRKPDTEKLHWWRQEVASIWDWLSWRGLWGIWVEMSAGSWLYVCLKLGRCGRERGPRTESEKGKGHLACIDEEAGGAARKVG